MLSNQVKQDIISKFKKSDNDTGSSQVQIAILNERIKQVSEHLKNNPKDKHSRVGLLKMVGRRKTFLNYLKRKDKQAYYKMSQKNK
ncbi:30S ribosomal protein S15 [Candidatus Dependentiae bacterium]|nr:30S ribosomal protein S15 [Candidatus Dependentiae bacterium]